MGLQNQLNDVSSDSIPLLLLALIATAVSHLRHFLHHHNFLHHSSSSTQATSDEQDLTTEISSSLVLLSEHLNANRILSHNFGDSHHDRADSDCIVCLSHLRHGDQVRRLTCRHVFHKSCFDGWLDHMNFNCPLCRSPLVEQQHQQPMAVA